MGKQERKKVKQEENTVLLDIKQEKRFRIKQFIFIQFMNGFYTLGLPIFLYLLYKAFYEQNIKFIILLVIMFIEPHIHPKKVGWAYKIGEWSEFHKWFDSYKIISEDRTIDTKKCLFTWMPHSVFCFPMLFLNFLKHNPIKQTLVGSRMVMKSPWMGTVAQWAGYQSVDPINFKKLMKNEENIGLVPGGFEEATIFSHKEYRVFNNNRKGFLKYAIQYGYNIHPVFVFNERKGYWSNDIFMNFRLLLNKIKFPGAVFASWYGLLPHKNIDVVIVVGKKIELPQKENPTNEELNKYYEIYIQSIKDIFNRNVEKYDPGTKLVFWDEQHNQEKKSN